MEFAGKKIYIRKLQPEDVSESYVSWMNDPEVVQFLESRWNHYSLDDLRSYVKALNETENNYFFGIFLISSDKHIGNIKVGEIDSIHRYANIGIMIGDKNFWGKGIASEAISLVSRFCFEHLNLNKLKSNVYEPNTGSHKAFIKAGFKEVGRYKRHRFYNGNYVGEIILEKLNPE
jgi:[ribosomal protein S5]-alanine N-acetyltransferase